MKEELKRFLFLKAGFLRPAQYVEWLSNIVPVMKKKGKVDFRDFNSATQKAHAADMLVELLRS